MKSKTDFVKFPGSEIHLDVHVKAKKLRKKGFANDQLLHRFSAPIIQRALLEINASNFAKRPPLFFSRQAVGANFEYEYLVLENKIHSRKTEGK